MQPQVARAAAVAGPAPGRVPQSSAQGEADHLSRPVRAPSSQMDLFDPKPGMAKRRGGCARVESGMRSAADHDDERAKSFPSPPRSSSSPSMRAACGSVTSCQHRPACRPVVHDPLDVHRADQPRSGDHVFQTGHQFGRPPGMRFLGELRPRQRMLTSRPTSCSRASARAARVRPTALRSPVGRGFLPTKHQGVRFPQHGDPVLYLADPAGVDRQTRRDTLDRIAALGLTRSTVIGDRDRRPHRTVRDGLPHAGERPEIIDFKDEPKHVLDAYGQTMHRPGSYAFNCLLARRLSEKGVRFVQLFLLGWDPAACRGAIEGRCRTPTRPRRRCSTICTAREACSMTRSSCGAASSAARSTRRARNHRRRTTAATTTAATTMLLAGAGIPAGPDLRRDRRLLLQHRHADQEGARCTISTPDHLHLMGSITYGSPTLPGPRLPAHRRARERGDGPARLTGAGGLPMSVAGPQGELISSTTFGAKGGMLAG